MRLEFSDQQGRPDKHRAPGAITPDALRLSGLPSGLRPHAEPGERERLITRFLTPERREFDE